MKLFLLIALLLAAIYAALCAWFYTQQRSFLYYPQFTRVAESSTDYSIRSGGVILRGWVMNPKASSPILYFGGNAESVQYNAEDFRRWFPDRSIYLLAYRGYGASEGEPSQQALFADALALYDAVRTEHPGQPIAAIGRSLGSGVASHLASQRELSRLALITPYDNMMAVGHAHFPWLPVRALLKDRYESTRYLGDYRGPLLILRAGHDSVVPPANTARLVAALKNAQVREIEIADADHDNISLSAEYAKALRDFMRGPAALTVPAAEVVSQDRSGVTAAD